MKYHARRCDRCVLSYTERQPRGRDAPVSIYSSLHSVHWIETKLVDGLVLSIVHNGYMAQMAQRRSSTTAPMSMMKARVLDRLQGNAHLCECRIHKVRFHFAYRRMIRRKRLLKHSTMVIQARLDYDIKPAFERQPAKKALFSTALALAAGFGRDICQSQPEL